MLNFAAGLDTRPYRLQLPESLRWIEVDLPEILAYKQEKLASITPDCKLERIALGLTNEQKRQQLFEHITVYELHREVGLEKLFRWLSYLPGRTIRQAFRFGDNLLLKRIDDAQEKV